MTVAMTQTATKAPRAGTAADDARAAGFGIYIHWPFCAQKCPYCDFNSHVRHGGWDEPRFLKAYITELETTAQDLGPRSSRPTVETIFFGGGTPSLMRAETVTALIDAVAQRFSMAADVEITLESNPGSADEGRFRGYRAAGVNRLSLGVQSLDPVALKALGRVHSVDDALRAITLSQSIFPRSSFDMIYARPGQTADQWAAELTVALGLAGEHLSLYQLTIEPETMFEKLHAAGKLVLPDDDAAGAFYEATQDALARFGLPAYEVSNYARPGAECRHNLIYWRYGCYVGIGPGAHGRLQQNGQRVATLTEKHPETWAALVERDGHGRRGDLILTAEETADEALLMGLRLDEGFDTSRLTVLASVTPEAALLDHLVSLGLLVRRGTHRIIATQTGRLVLNRVVAEISASLRPASLKPVSTP